MSNRTVKCKNDQCANSLELENSSQCSQPILFCSENCLDSFLASEDARRTLSDHSAKEINKYVQNVISQTEIIQQEFENLKRMRETYFDLFKKVDIKEETYIRKWSFKDEVK